MLGAPNISHNLRFGAPKILASLQSNKTPNRAKFHGPIPNRGGGREPLTFSNFLDHGGV